MTVSSTVRVTGPLEPFRDGLRRSLESEGYAPGPVGLHLCLLAHLSRWLGERGLGVGELTSEVVEEFFAARRRRYSWLTTARSLAPMLGYLRSVGVVSAEPDRPTPASAVDQLLGAYRRYLVRERGLAPASVQMYLPRAGGFIAASWPSGEIAVEELDAATIVAFVRRGVAGLSVPSARCLLSALRSFLRFLHATGRTERPLAEAVPAAAVWRRASIPRAVPAQTAGRLLASCDATTARGRRDAAILRMLLRLGLRAGEVAGLLLDDLDWRAGEVVVRGKGRRVERLPLPPDVGEAIVAYLTGGRVDTARRGLFLRLPAPHAPLSRYGVRSVVYHACDRAGLPRVGPHRLRHTAGTETLRAGASLNEVAQLLRHRSVETTAIYAKVDRAALAALARPWPAGAA